jgi:hypothetical protein
MDERGFLVFEFAQYACVEKAAEGCRSPKPGGNSERPANAKRLVRLRFASTRPRRSRRRRRGVCQPSGALERGNGHGDAMAGHRFPRRDRSRRTKARTCPRTPKPHSEFRRGNGSRQLGARSWAMTEIRLVALKSHESGCRRTGIRFRFSFWDGRLGQRVFESLMLGENHES